jgi:hypothetical protein
LLFSTVSSPSSMLSVSLFRLLIVCIPPLHAHTPHTRKHKCTLIHTHSCLCTVLSSLLCAWHKVVTQWISNKWGYLFRPNTHFQYKRTKLILICPWQMTKTGLSRIFHQSQDKIFLLN